MPLHSNCKKGQHGVVEEKQSDLFKEPAEYAFAHYIYADRHMAKGLRAAFINKFGQLQKLKRQEPKDGKVIQIMGEDRRLFYLVAKKLLYQRPLIKMYGDGEPLPKLETCC